MSEENKDNSYADDVLKRLFKPSQIPPKESLKELFERRMQELKITPTNVLELLKMEYRTYNAILNGTQKRVDFINLIKISNFLQIPTEQMVQLYIDALEKNFSDEIPVSSERIKFIKENFDLTVLRSAGFINSITDFDEIEKKITSFFGLKSIFDYEKPHVDVAFSAGLVKPKNELTRSLWIKTAQDYFEAIDNPYEYDRKKLVDYFPQIRWYSTNVEMGLINIIQELFKLGVTVIFLPILPSLHLRGATFAVDGRPCVVLTDYRGFYPTLWFALIHELFHVIFDWDEISKNRYSYHLSDEDNDQLTVIEKEKEADNFAREYLFSKEKMNAILPNLKDEWQVYEYAKLNHVHYSFIYVFHAYDAGKKDRMAWARAKRKTPNIDALTNPLKNPWTNPKPVAEFVKSIKYKLYK